ncbi:hypothetical protein A3F00_04760 [Candidatus Daviesbacteria bacterium RIFCSPHIGHO2_12_FULL_37_11]|uniref:Glycosyltransferase RgtA/B/C/D-like domain-containing protein n=1 Tax=Candidatus Daviesbacteria bacterium RIFCSPHIGHO2_12_FULL_37_11 TaxID=1797777 RepID=A0A1F5KB89_9BACT|nr:MAG: hypothetical protein A3F00_04760 [Candidatus Daviesbacteria bacterium RIFCSPHIGHO2_12_FULL_37_11]
MSMFKNIIQFIIRHKLLLLILIIALFFRTYAVVERFEYAHDADLFSWIVKDIVVNHHSRLIGQLTSANGIYIGSFFYYLLIPFFWLTHMDPIGSIVPITIIGMSTVFSYWWVFKKLFNPTIGFIAAFLYGTLLWTVQFDRHVYPSTLSNIWTIWFFYVVISISRGKYQVLPILGILIGLVWHIHIALAPTLLTIPVAAMLSLKVPNIKQLFLFFLTLVITSVPLIIFETRHNFIQTISLFNNFSVDHGGGSGLPKLNLILIKLSSNIQNLIFYPSTQNIVPPILILTGILLSGIFIVKKKLMHFKELIPLYVWITGVVLFFTFSSTIISEYYFANVEVVFIGILSMLTYLVFKSSNAGKYFILTLLSVILIKNFIFFITQDYYNKGYLERKGVVEFISKDSKEKGFSCIAVSYITTPGENVGFRYFFYLKNLHVNQPWSGSPVYSVVLPDELAAGDNEVLFGHIKVIPPNSNQIKSPEEIKRSCSGQNSNLTDPLFGYTE